MTCQPSFGAVSALVVAALLSAAMPPAAGAQTIGEEPGTIFQQIGDALQTAGEVTRERAIANAEISHAREAFFAAYPDGRELAQAERTLADLLLAKDLYYLGLYIGVGPNSTRPAVIEAMTGGKLDGGIRPAARPHFDTWVNAVRRELGAGHPDQVLFVTNPERVRAAIQASEQDYLGYKAARDRAEFGARGIQPVGAQVGGSGRAGEASPGTRPDPRARATPTQRPAARGGARQQYLEEIFIQRYGGEEQGKLARYGFSAAFTVDRFEEAAWKIYEAAKDDDGLLADPTELGLDPGTRHPYEALETLLMRDHPAPYVLEWLRDGDPRVRSIADAGHAWSKLIHTHGQANVLAAAEAVRASLGQRAGRPAAEDVYQRFQSALDATARPRR